MSEIAVGQIEYLDALVDAQGKARFSWDEWPEDYIATVARKGLVAKYAWACPDERALEIIARHAPILEVGAGKGYWAHLLRERGVDILATDRKPEPDPWTEVLQRDHRVAAEHPDRALLLVWPCYGKPWAHEALRLYRGETLIYVGEAEGGCTGDDDFHLALTHEWTPIEMHEIPQWWGLYDNLYVYRRRAGEGD